MSETDKLLFAAEIRKIVKEELSSFKYTCRFGDTNADGLDEYIAMISRLGNNNIGQGLDVIRENHLWLLSQRENAKRLSRIFWAVALTAFLGGVSAALWAGVKGLILYGSGK